MPGEKVMSTMLPAGDFFNDAEDPLSVQEFWKEATFVLTSSNASAQALRLTVEN